MGIATSQAGTPTEVAVYQLKTILTNAQIKSLPSAPIQILAAEGAGKAIMCVSATIQFNIPTPYTNISTETVTGPPISILGLIYGEGWDDDALPTWNAHPAVGSLASLFSDGNILFFSPLVYRFGGSYSSFTPSPYILNKGDIDNAGIWLWCSNMESGSSLGDFTAGDDLNSMEITIAYSIVDL